MAEVRGGAAEETGRRDEPVDEHLPPEMDVRDDDLEPHEGLRYVARLFKILAVLLVLLLVGEVIVALVQQGNTAIPMLMTAATRTIVFAGLMWGAGDMALMLIESNHDLRATRILVGRLNGKMARLEAKYAPHEDEGRHGRPSRTGMVERAAPRPGEPRPGERRPGEPPSSREL
jgi:hypothetical protein